MRYHKAHLTRRLILETSVDNEIEENMVDWLRVCYHLYLNEVSMFVSLVILLGISAKKKQCCRLVSCNESNTLIIQCELTPHVQADLMFCFGVSKGLYGNTV